MDTTTPETAPVTPVTVSDILQKYERDCFDELAPRTQIEYHRHIRLLSAKFGHLIAADLLDTNFGSRRRSGAVVGSAVRRLTPRECERLQAFPDDYTAIPFRGSPAKDAPRYKALGNSMCTNVIRWLGERIELVESVAQEIAA